MKPLSRGTVLLATSVALWACSGDPTDNFRGSPAEITATPTSLFIVRGQTKQVIVEVVDEQGNPLNDPVTVSGGSGITITPDPNYLATTAEGGQSTSEHAFNVTANELVSTSFTVSAGDKTRNITVGVVPGTVDIPLATVASTGPNASVPTVLTLPAPYRFFPDSGVTFSGGPGIIIDRSADGRSITVLPVPGTTGQGAVTVAVDYLPNIPLPTLTDVPLTIDTIVPAMAGTGDPATAPEITIPALGASGGFFDAGTYGAATCAGNSGAPCQLYKFTLAAETTFDLVPRWSNTADVGVYFMTADGTADTDQACDAHGNATDPEGFAEHCVITLPAGTYLAGIVSYGPFYAPPDPNPTWVGLDIHTIPPE